MTGIADRLVDTLKKTLDIHSPSRVMRALGVFTGRGLVEGITSTGNDVEDASSMLATRTIAGFSTAPALPASGSSSTAPAVGASVALTYNDYSTSQEDKQSKLSRAGSQLQAAVAASVNR